MEKIQLEQDYQRIKDKNKLLEEKIMEIEGREEKTRNFYKDIIRNLRTPLNIILGTADLMNEGKVSERNKANYINSIQDNTRQLITMLDDVMEISAIRSGISKLDHAVFDMLELIGEISNSNQQRFQVKNIAFNVYMSHFTENYVYGDEHRVYEILDGILKTIFSLADGSEEVSLLVEQLEVINDNMKMRFTVRSSGGNIDEQSSYLQQLMDEKETVLESYSYDKTIFGLSLSKYLVEIFGGTFYYHFSPEELELRIELKFKSAEKQTQTNEFRNVHTLFIYDANTSSEEQQQMIKSVGIKYDSCLLEEDLLLLMEQAKEENHPYQVIIFDWNLSKLSTLIRIREIRNIFGKDLIIIYTNTNANRIKEDAKKAGANFALDRYRFMSSTKEIFTAIVSGKYQKQENENVVDKNYNFDGKLILIAEDVSLNMQIIVKMLSKVNASFVCVENGQEAVNTFLSKPIGFFDCIFMDINMPVMDGYSATKLIRGSKREDSNIPIYAMSANAMLNDVVLALECGMDGHIEKPVNESLLYRTLDKIFTESEKVEIKERTKELQQENAALREKAEHDPLTGLLNRYGFEIRTEELMDKPVRIGYLIIDVDYFKSVNDTLGHDVGDQILVKVSKLLKQTFREEDYIVRLGGDEFVVLLINCEDTDDFVSNRIDNMNELLGNPDDGLPPVSLSAGVVFSEMGYQKDMYLLADSALYKTKQNGRKGCTVKG